MAKRHLRPTVACPRRLSVERRHKAAQRVTRPLGSRVDIEVEVSGVLGERPHQLFIRVDDLRGRIASCRRVRRAVTPLHIKGYEALATRHVGYAAAGLLSPITT